jgi:hypothetical protein
VRLKGAFFRAENRTDLVGYPIMVRLSKKVEYGLIAISHIAAKSPGEVVPAKEIADTYRIPFDLVAKVLQRLVFSVFTRPEMPYGGLFPSARPLVCSSDDAPPRTAFRHTTPPFFSGSPGHMIEKNIVEVRHLCTPGPLGNAAKTW